MDAVRKDALDEGMKAARDLQQGMVPWDPECRLDAGPEGAHARRR